jgi:hypothetical protein
MSSGVPKVSHCAQYFEGKSANLYMNQGISALGTSIAAGFSGGFMSPTVQAGTILIEDRPFMAQVLGLETEPYFGNWGVVKMSDNSALDRKIHAAGWNCFFMAGEVKGMFFGAVGALKVQKALKRILESVKHENYNSLEVTGIVAKRFLGLPYTVVSAHSRHIQQSCNLDTAQGRLMSQHDAAWARG